MNTKMAINTYISIIESKKQNNQAEQKQNHKYRERFDGCQIGGGPGEWMKKVKGLRSINWLLRNSHGDVKYCIWNIVARECIDMCMTHGHGQRCGGGLREGVLGGWGQRGKNWDNCNSLYNKI